MDAKPCHAGPAQRCDAHEPLLRRTIDGVLRTCLIAEELAKVYPELVTRDEHAAM